MCEEFGLNSDSGGYEWEVSHFLLHTGLSTNHNFRNGVLADSSCVELFFYDKTLRKKRGVYEKDTCSILRIFSFVGAW